MVRPGPPPDTPWGTKLPAVIAWCAYHLPRWYAIRFPLALAGFLVVFAPFALWGVPAMFRSMLILTGNGLTTVALFATAAGATAIASWRIVILYGGVRFGLFWRPGRVRAARLSFPVLLALIAPLLVAAIGTSVQEHRVQLIPAILQSLSGILCGVGLFVLFTILHAAIVEPTDDLPDILLPSNITVVRRAHAFTFRHPAHRDPTPFVQWLERYLGPGYFARDGRLLAGHTFAIGLFVIFAALYATGYLWTPGTARGARVPALVYLLGIGTLLTWFFSSFAFWLDRHRLPTIPIVFVLLLGCWALADTDHYFHLSPPSTVTPQFESPETIAGARKHDLLTVIAIDGGGIQAGGWAATVLTGIARQWPDFQQSVRFISSVSGGSLASMYFVGELTSSGVLSETQIQRIQRLTMRGSFE